MVIEAAPTSANIEANQSTDHIVTAMMYDEDINLSLNMPAGSHITGHFSSDNLVTPWGSSDLTLQTSHLTPPGIYEVIVQGNSMDLVTITINVGLNNVLYLPLTIKQ